VNQEKGEKKDKRQKQKVEVTRLDRGYEVKKYKKKKRGGKLAKVRAELISKPEAGKMGQTTSINDLRKSQIKKQEEDEKRKLERKKFWVELSNLIGAKSQKEWEDTIGGTEGGGGGTHAQGGR